MTTTNETKTDDAVDTVLAAHEIRYTVRHVRATTRKHGTEKPWECDQWAVELTCQGITEEFDYFTGTGHRKPTRPTPRPAYTPGTLAYEQWQKTFRPVAPRAASVLYSLLMDSDAVGQSFAQWCAELGYNADSISDRATYDACQANADKLARVVPGDVRNELATLLEGY